MSITPSQTVGPYYAYALTPDEYDTRPVFSPDLTVPGLAGARIRIEGQVFDGDGAPVPDAMIEIWQADAAGSLAHGAGGAKGANAAFKGFGRAQPKADGSYSFTTVKPGRVKGANGKLQAPHISVTVFARGMLLHLFTRIYFSGEASNAEDQVLALVPAERRGTLIAKAGAVGVYRFDIRLQGQGDAGEGETVFFEA